MNKEKTEEKEYIYKIMWGDLADDETITMKILHYPKEPGDKIKGEQNETNYYTPLVKIIMAKPSHWLEEQTERIQLPQTAIGEPIKRAINTNKYRGKKPIVTIWKKNKKKAYIKDIYLEEEI